MRKYFYTTPEEITNHFKTYTPYFKPQKTRTYEGKIYTKSGYGKVSHRLSWQLIKIFQAISYSFATLLALPLFYSSFRKRLVKHWKEGASGKETCSLYQLFVSKEPQTTVKIVSDLTTCAAEKPSDTVKSPRDQEKFYFNYYSSIFLHESDAKKAKLHTAFLLISNIDTASPQILLKFFEKLFETDSHPFLLSYFLNKILLNSSNRLIFLKILFLQTPELIIAHCRKKEITRSLFNLTTGLLFDPASKQDLQNILSYLHETGILLNLLSHLSLSQYPSILYHLTEPLQEESLIFLFQMNNSLSRPTYDKLFFQLISLALHEIQLRQCSWENSEFNKLFAKALSYFLVSVHDPKEISDAFHAMIVALSKVLPEDPDLIDIDQFDIYYKIFHSLYKKIKTHVKIQACSSKEQLISALGNHQQPAIFEYFLDSVAFYEWDFAELELICTKTSLSVFHILYDSFTEDKKYIVQQFLRKFTEIEGQDRLGIDLRWKIIQRTLRKPSKTPKTMFKLIELSSKKMPGNPLRILYEELWKNLFLITHENQQILHTWILDRFYKTKILTQIKCDLTAHNLLEIRLSLDYEDWEEKDLLCLCKLKDFPILFPELSIKNRTYLINALCSQYLLEVYLLHYKKNPPQDDLHFNYLIFENQNLHFLSSLHENSRLFTILYQTNFDFLCLLTIKNQEIIQTILEKKLIQFEVEHKQNLFYESKPIIPPYEEEEYERRVELFLDKLKPLTSSQLQLFNEYFKSNSLVEWQINEHAFSPPSYSKKNADILESLFNLINKLHDANIKQLSAHKIRATKLSFLRKTR